MTNLTGRLSTALADRYKIERHLGEGGMATVYLAYTSPIWYTSGRSNGCEAREREQERESHATPSTEREGYP